MFIAVMMAAALALGYTATVVLSMVFTFAITMSMPKLVVGPDYLIRNGYKLIHEGSWLLCAGVGGFVTSLVVKTFHPQLTALALMAALIWVLWDNSWEARQRGMAHQVLITGLTVVGVAAGYLLQRQVF